MEARILSLTRQAPPDGSTHWSTRKLAKVLGLQHTVVARAWRQAGLKPQLASDPQAAAVGVEEMKAGIALSGWFEGQARRVYRGIEENEQERERRAVCDWIANRGGKTTLRDLSRNGPYRFRSRACELLNDLAAAGLVRASLQPGRRAEEYVLCDCDTCDNEGGTQ
jgi:hypothetical protein